MSNGKRYVTAHVHNATWSDSWEEGKQGDINCPLSEGRCKTYELGPEVYSPDYTKLVAWLVVNATNGVENRSLFHPMSCPRRSTIPTSTCNCGLTEALQAAIL